MLNEPNRPPEPKRTPPADAAPGDALTLAKGAGITLGGRAVGRGVQLASQALLGKVLGPETFGVYAIGWTLLRMLGFLGPLGLDRGVIRFGSRYWKDDVPTFKGILIECLAYAGLGSGALALLLYAASPWMSRVMFDEPRLVGVIRGFAPALVLLAAMRVATSATRATQRMQYSVLAEDLGQPTSNLFLVVIFFLAGWRLGGAVAAASLSFGVALLMAVYYLGRLVPGLLRAHVRPVFLGRELLSFSIPASIAGMLGAYLVWIDRLILGAFRPSGAVGVYQAVSQFSILFAIILGAIGAVCAPMVARFHHRGESNRLAELYRVSTKWSLYLSLPAYLVMVTIPADLLSVIFTEEFAVGWLPLIVLATGQALNVGGGTVAMLLVMSGHPRAWLTLSASALAVNIGLNLALIPRWGLLGAAIATAASLSALWLAGLLQVKKTLGLWPYDRRYLKGLVATIVTAAILISLKISLDLTGVSAVLLTPLVAILAFGGVLAVLGFDPEDRVLLQAIRSRVG
jgi:O-antigen/teichoic acid export membrane protein